jgi:hypothetical protein
MMVPVGIPASTLDDPSSGSKTATYFSPSSMTISLDLALSGRMSIGVSSSSDARTPILPVKRRARLRISLAMTSSF